MAYRKHRRLFFSIILITSVAILGGLFYKDFLTPPAIQSNENAPKNLTIEAPMQTSPPNQNERQAYSVPPSHPRRLTITAIGVDALIKPVYTLPSGTLDAPKTAWDVGWYANGGLPGNRGAMLIDGHVNDTYGTPGIFANLNKLKVGDELSIERGDGTSYSYRVAKTAQIPLEKVDMKELLRPISGDEGLNLITCGGTYQRKSATYSDRILIFATKV